MEFLSPTSNEKWKTVHENRYDWFAKRYLLAGILCSASFCLSCLNKSTSMALLEMTKNRTIEMNGTTIQIGPEFDWNSKAKGLILSAYAYGNLSAFMMTWIVKKFGGITTCGFALLQLGLINVLQPSIIQINFYLFLAMRIIEGILKNFAYLSTFEIWSNWAPKAERSKLVAVQTTGAYISAAAIFPISGYLAHFWQWPSMFYFTGGIAILVSSTMLLLFSNEPSTDRYILQKERKYLMQEVESSEQDKVNYPWKQIFTSVPLWALFLMKFSNICGLTFIGLCLPLYVKDITNLQIHQIGIISGIPNILGIIMVPIFGWLADYTQNKNHLNPTQVHKTYTFIGLVLGGICYFSITLIKSSDFAINIVLLIAVKILLSLSDLVTQFVPLYIAPNHSSLIVSIISYTYFLAVSLIPMLIGYVVTTHDVAEWNIVLSSIGAILLSGGLIFIFFGSSEPQPWSLTRNEPSREQNTADCSTL